MQIEIGECYATIRREWDPRVYRESTLYRHIARKLRELGHDVVVKRMAKDGHLRDDKEFYIRERRWKWALYFGHWQIRNPHTDYNHGELVLMRAHGDAW